MTSHPSPTNLMPNHASWPLRKKPPGRGTLRANARKAWFVRMAQRHRLVPAPDSKPSARAELARLLTVYVWWRNVEDPAFDTREQTKNYINRMPWEVLVERGYDPREMPRYCVTLPGGYTLDVLVLAHGEKEAKGVLSAALPEGSSSKKVDKAFVRPRPREDARGWYSEMAGYGFVFHPTADKGVNPWMSELMPHRFPTATSARGHRQRAKADHGITLETQLEQCLFRDGVVVNIKLPGARYGTPMIVNANTAREAEDVLRKHPNLPEGTKISGARFSLRLNQPPKEENDHDV